MVTSGVSWPARDSWSWTTTTDWLAPASGSLQSLTSLHLVCVKPSPGLSTLTNLQARWRCLSRAGAWRCCHKRARVKIVPYLESFPMKWCGNLHLFQDAGARTALYPFGPDSGLHPARSA